MERGPGPRCHHLASLAYQRITELTNHSTLIPRFTGLVSQMVSLLSPTLLTQMNSRISSTIDISEFPIISWITGNFIRISIQCYNDESDINALMNALTHLIPF